jgi:hypothetical protein
MATLGEGEGVWDQFAFWELARVQVHRGLTGWGGAIASGWIHGELVNGFDQHFRRGEQVN